MCHQAVATKVPDRLGCEFPLLLSDIVAKPDMQYQLVSLPTIASGREYVCISVPGGGELTVSDPGH